MERIYVGGSSTGYRGGVSRAFGAPPRAKVTLAHEAALRSVGRSSPPLVLLTRPVRCDDCGREVPAGGRGRYYGGRQGVKFYGEGCH